MVCQSARGRAAPDRRLWLLHSPTDAPGRGDLGRQPLRTTGQSLRVGPTLARHMPVVAVANPGARETCYTCWCTGITDVSPHAGRGHSTWRLCPVCSRRFSTGVASTINLRTRAECIAAGVEPPLSLSPDGATGEMRDRARELMRQQRGQARREARARESAVAAGSSSAVRCCSGKRICCAQCAAAAATATATTACRRSGARSAFLDESVHGSGH